MLLESIYQPGYQTKPRQAARYHECRKRGCVKAYGSQDHARGLRIDSRRQTNQLAKKHPFTGD
jgi:hypothetical protein